MDQFIKEDLKISALVASLLNFPMFPNLRMVISTIYPLYSRREKREEPVLIEFQCKFVRKQQNGIAVKFTSVNAFHYEHFKNLMVMNGDDPEKLLNELERSPGLIIDS